MPPASTGSLTPELLTRWMEVGASKPLYRNHAIKGGASQEHGCTCGLA
jgi:alpha-glucosidase (family GH31 glycosyl hydrolase)